MPSDAYQTFLVEVGVEEIPSRFLDGLAEAFGRTMEEALAASRLPYENASVGYTPRRLTFQAGVAAAQVSEVETVRGPAVAIAWKNGEPTPALAGFLRRVQMPAEALGRAIVSGKEYVTADVNKPQQSAAQTLPGIIAEVLGRLPQPRTMRWNGDDHKFIRPVRWILALVDDVVLSGEALGVSFGQLTYGNRTDYPEAMAVTAVDDYWRALEEGKVLLDPLKRRQIISEAALTLAQKHGGQAQLDEELLDEVTNLVEWPTPFVGAFDEPFLQIPEAILVTSMRVHQRYFPVRGENRRLLPYFLAVRNGQGEDLDLVRRGNQKVLRARLSDARYFFENDRKWRLEDRAAGLAQMTLHAKLGTYADKVERVRQLFERTRGWWKLGDARERLLMRAITLYKCDLLTQVVGEFPELQGEMGGIYARLDGEEALVADAVRDQYRPASGKDELPSSPISQVLGLLDRVDTLISFYHAGIRATGSEDPFGLRRAALGVARLLVETAALGTTPTIALLREAQQVVGAPDAVGDEVLGLVQSRLESQWEGAWPREALGAVLARDFAWANLFQRLGFLTTKGADVDEVANAYKRVSRIIGQAAAEMGEHAYEGIEAELYDAALAAGEVADNQLEPWWSAVKDVVPLVDQYFEQVLVMDPDSSVRRRHFSVLQKVHAAIGRYFDWNQL